MQPGTKRLSSKKLGSPLYRKSVNFEEKPLGSVGQITKNVQGGSAQGSALLIVEAPTRESILADKLAQVSYPSTTVIALIALFTSFF